MADLDKWKINRGRDVVILEPCALLMEDDEEGEGMMGFQQLGGGSLEGSWMRPPWCV